MAWIESHQSLAKHKKLLRLAGLLRTDRITLIGHLHLLWWWGLDNADIDGNLGDVTSYEISEAAEWKGDPDEFASALEQAGFLERHDDHFVLHDWYDYAGKLNEARAKERERSRRRRAEQKQQTAEQPTVGRRSTTGQPPVDQQTTVGTQPNLTIPNLDDDDDKYTRARGDDPEWRALTLAVFGETFDRYHAEALAQDCEDLGEEVVKEAMRRTVERSTQNRLSYYRRIVNSWRGKVRSLDDLRKLEEVAKPNAVEIPMSEAVGMPRVRGQPQRSSRLLPGQDPNMEVIE